MARVHGSYQGALGRPPHYTVEEPTLWGLVGSFTGAPHPTAHHIEPKGFATEKGAHEMSKDKLLYGFIGLAFVVGFIGGMAVGVKTESSNPARFVHIEKSPVWEMFDSKTGQSCVTYSVDNILDVNQQEASEAARSEAPKTLPPDFFNQRAAEQQKLWNDIEKENRSLIDRAMNPLLDKSVRYHGMPPCSKLIK